MTNEAIVRTTEHLKHYGITDHKFNYIDDDFVLSSANARRGDREISNELLSGDQDTFDDSVSYMIDNGDGTTTFSYRCAQDQFKIENSQIISLEVIGICGDSSLFHLVFSY